LSGATTANLGSIQETPQETLLPPLWGRALETRKPHPLLVDQTAVRIIDVIDYDFSAIARKINFISQMAWIACSLHTDRTIRDFLGRHPGATIVNLGCGLDTTFERVDNGRICWYDLDLPDVIELRESYIQESRRKSIAASLLDTDWRQLKGAESIFLVASSVLYYFEEAQVKAFLIGLADAQPCSDILFDACSPRGLVVANRRVIKAGGMDDSAMLKWGIEQPKDMESEYPP